MSDELSFWTSSLSLWITFILVFLKSNKLQKLNKLIFSMMVLLILTFNTWNFMMFYLMFEMSMILVLLVIMVWGYQPERVEAMLMMIVMTVLVSIPFLLSMMNNVNNLNFWMVESSLSMWEYMSLMVIFMMKMPTTFLHMWLPKVHVESPIQGSMILASVLLKLGSYGIVRTIAVTNKFNMSFAHVAVSFGVWTGIVMSVICLMQTDLKTLIAYSSIVHMTMVFTAIIINKNKGMLGSISIMLGHGVCSSGLFFMTNIMYKYSKSRSAMINKGVLFCSPMSAALWFILCMGNAPMPPSINILGEFMTFKTITNWSTLIMCMVVPSIFVSSMYSIYLFYLPVHGKYTSMIKKTSPMNSKYTNITMMHIMPMIVIMVKPYIITI